MGYSDEGRQKQTVASLGCGTLILIALIVLFFGNSGTDALETEIRSLTREVEMLRREQSETKRLVETLVLRSGGEAEDSGEPATEERPTEFP